MNKACNCPSCRGNRERNEARTFIAIMERSFGAVPSPWPDIVPVRTVRDILGGKK